MASRRPFVAGLGIALLAPLVAPAASAAPPPDPTVTRAVDYLRSQQQADGSFEVAQFAGFETPDAVFALASAAQTGPGWDVAAAVTTIFVEGTEYERGELEPGAARRPVAPLHEHPLVKHYGLPLERLELLRAHRMVEGDHRQAAWRIVLDYVEPARRQAVVAAMQRVLVRWQAYRDAVAEACGVSRAE